VNAELAALLALVAGAIARELLTWLDRRSRRRGGTRTRASDEPPVDPV